MTALNFQNSPEVNDVFITNGKTYVWNGVSWNNISSGFTGSAGVAGEAGFTGSVGFTGSIGFVGSAGEDGKDTYARTIAYLGL